MTRGRANAASPAGGRAEPCTRTPLRACSAAAAHTHRQETSQSEMDPIAQNEAVLYPYFITEMVYETCASQTEATAWALSLIHI